MQPNPPDTPISPAPPPVDLSNCEREPIHIPGSIQPHGVLLGVIEPELRIVWTSANLADHLGADPAAVLGAPVGTVLGPGATAALAQHLTAFGDLRERNPLELTLAGGAKFDAILHRMQAGLLIIELEPSQGPRPFTFPNTYQPVRTAIAELNRAVDLSELYDTTAQAVRALTGFDRVMVYHYDQDYNGEVVAEAKLDTLNSFLGLHYPASDIPAQARALYEKNWIRLIADVRYTPAPLLTLPRLAPDGPLDLTYATLRSVSPIHIEYLQNMGVEASMSISLMHGQRLWGLIACHHYSGPHLPPYATRAAAEFLASTLSLRLVDRAEQEASQRRLRAGSALTRIATRALGYRTEAAEHMFDPAELLSLVPADGVLIKLTGETVQAGQVPDTAWTDALIARLAAWDEDVPASGCLIRDLPELPPDDRVAGALAIMLPDAQAIVWLRAEERRTVDWGGDPHNKAIAVVEADSVRLSPRKSFERWREVVRDCSRPWTAHEIENATELRTHALEALYLDAQHELLAAQQLQRSLLERRLPSFPGWQVSAHYETPAGRVVGGDWYDVVRSADSDAIMVVLGDVAGHGLPAAGTMAQLRNAVRAQLLAEPDPAQALRRLSAYVSHYLPRTFATSVIARIELATGRVILASAGHLPPLVRRAGEAAVLPITPGPPLGVADAAPHRTELLLQPGEGLVFFSDGLVERRDRDLDVSLAQLTAAVCQLSGPISAQQVYAHAEPDAHDDITVLTVHREG
ncbi:MAG TPA: SpoIIE family protein phosphatase [Jatrophihabitans sp.]|nr:SpoIIE family protein phosphatase [Jatrophihabitans sp.]